MAKVLCTVHKHLLSTASDLSFLSIADMHVVLDYYHEAHHFVFMLNPSLSTARTPRTGGGIKSPSMVCAALFCHFGSV